MEHLIIAGFVLKQNLWLFETNKPLKQSLYRICDLYMGFYLKKLIELAQIMKKEFYVVIPYDAVEDKSVRDRSVIWTFKNFWSWINGQDDLFKIREQLRQFTGIKKWLSTRVNWVKTSLESMWIKANEINKSDLVKLLKDYYNPRLDNYTAIKTDISDINVL